MRQLKAGTADVSVVLRIVDSTDGTPEQGVVAATAGLAFWYRRTGGTLVAIAGLSDLGALDAAHADGGLLHIDDGYYRLDVPDLAFAAGADEVHVGGAATGMVAIACGVQLVGYSPRTELTTAVLANVGDILLDTAEIGVAGAGLTALPALVWAHATRTLTSFGTLLADIWAYATRTLTQSAASTAATVAGSTVTVTRGDTWTVPLTGLGDISARTKLWYTMKGRESDADSASTVQVEETGGLLYLNGAATTTTNATLVVDDETAGNVTLTVKPAASSTVAKGGYSYDVQMLTAAGAVTTLTSGSQVVDKDITRAIA